MIYVLFIFCLILFNKICYHLINLLMIFSIIFYSHLSFDSKNGHFMHEHNMHVYSDPINLGLCIISEFNASAGILQVIKMKRVSENIQQVEL